MSKFTKILCPTDFSPYAEHAMRYAYAFAKKYGAQIHCVHVIDSRAIEGGGIEGVYTSQGDIESMRAAIAKHAEEKMSHVVRRAKAHGFDIGSTVTWGAPADGIAKAAEANGSDLIIIATHGRSGLDRLVLGSTCDKVLRTSKAPVLAVKQGEHEFVEGTDGAIELHRILVPCDFSEFSRKAVPVAADLCRQFGAVMVLEHVVDTWLDYPEFTPQVELNNSPHLTKSAQESLDKLAAAQQGVKVEANVRTGVPHRVLSEQIEKDAIDLVVMATHGRTGLAHLLLGSVTEKLVRKANCPVLTLHPSQL